jgi:hypothetical protein
LFIDSRFRVQGIGFKVLGSMVQGSGFWVQGSRFRVWGFAFGFDPTRRVQRRRWQKSGQSNRKRYMVSIDIQALAGGDKPRRYVLGR